MSFFTIDKTTGTVFGISQQLQNAPPDKVLQREVKNGELELFRQGHTQYDEKTDSLVRPNITSAAELRVLMVRTVKNRLDALAVENGYVDLADLLTFTTSKNKERKALAEKALALRDKARDAVDAYIDGLKTVNVSAAEALSKLPKMEL